ncbi:hypothetical protein BFP77_08270 [Maribacter sp. 4U21]|uniref:hypothetical protein n=1 Tax=Maribacter sp. 4U21 TaxID=1889779 RepID=UPI000C14D570|nr:hypothetical protein [Maribacter sp. 4U21]PIB28902.1 hypothetical protein BFP77_08270 [Maribacter sp. 4U21]
MARHRQLIELRNANIKKRYDQLTKKHKEWRHDAIIDKIAGEFFLSSRTISAIFNDEGTYGNNIGDDSQLALFS